MEIIRKTPHISNEAVDKALIDEIKNGYALEAATEKDRVDIARKEARQEQGKTHPVLGKCVATMPAREFFRLVNKYGHETVHSKEFLSYYNKKFPDLSPNKA